MHIDQQGFINSRLGVGFAQLVSRLLPPRIAYPFAYRLADFVATRQGWDVIHTIRTNQWVVSGQTLAGDELDNAVRETVRNTAHSVYDLYHYFHDPEAIKRMTVVDATIRSKINQTQTREAGIIVAVVHVGSHLGFLATFLVGLRALMLTLSESSRGHQWQLQMLRNVGLEIVPANLTTLRQAIRRLCAGGVVLTGVDRPISTTKYMPHFFGHPSVLPVHHIQLALKANVPILVAAMIRQPDNTYKILLSELIQMEPHPDRRIEITMNAEAVLRVAEKFIRQAPHQWSISVPVWPALMDQVPW